MRAAACTKCGEQVFVDSTHGRVPTVCRDCDPALAQRRDRHRRAWERRQTSGTPIETALRTVAGLAEDLDPQQLDRLAVRRAITRVAHAAGPYELRAQLLELAAVALAWGARLPIDSKDIAA